jgi:antitoxin component YwqK of YwqJK toxin-antitoxin module
MEKLFIFLGRFLGKAFASKKGKSIFFILIAILIGGWFVGSYLNEALKKKQNENIIKWLAAQSDSIEKVARQKVISDSILKASELDNEKQTEILFEARERQRYLTNIDTSKNGLEVIWGLTPQDTLMKAYYVRGRRNGECVWYFKNAHTIASREYYLNDTLEGTRITYFNTGEKQFVENYSNGVLTGKYLEYYEGGNGGIHFEYNYDNEGKMNGFQLEYSKGGGLLYAKDYYNHGHLEVDNDSKSKSFQSDGTKCSQCFGHYQGGFCNLCGKAAPDRQNETYSKATDCEFCGGTGFIKSSGIKERTKVCPSCKGKGKQIY